MLVLSRKCGEQIVIGESIRVIVKSVGRSGAVRIAIEAPDDVTIRRGELRPYKRRERKAG